VPSKIIARDLSEPGVTTVLMVRHADVHNPDNLIYARLPRFHLSDVGRGQVRLLAKALGTLNVAAIYASPRLRARQTAAVLASNLGIARVRRSSLIDEVLTGYQGKPYSALTGKVNFYDNPAHPDDETIPRVARRMRSFLALAQARHPGEVILGVSHADPIMILRAKALGLPLVIKNIQGRYYPAKCSLMQFSFPPGQDRPIVIYRELVKDQTKPKPVRGKK
jgi:broad specificity phosphatase PhoE